MSCRLALSLPLKHMETPASYVAWLARRNGTLPREFCSDGLLRWPHVCSAYPEHIQRLAKLSGAPIDELTLCSAPMIGRLRYRVGHSTATSATFRRAITRICLRCIEESIDEDGDAGPYQRLDWLLLCLAGCHRHDVPLIQIESAGYSHQTYDIVAQVYSQMDEVRKCSDKAEELPPTSFETYLRHRANQGAKGDWLDPLSLTDLHRGSLYLGIQSLFHGGRRIGELSVLEKREAIDTGFSFLVSGPDALVREMDRLRINYSCERPYFSKDLGEFYTWLKSYRDAPQLAALRSCVEDYVLASYPLQTGKTVLTKKMAVPRCMTLDQVRKEHGIGAVRVRGLLAQIRGVTPKDLADLKDIDLTDLETVLKDWHAMQNVKDCAEDLSILTVQVKALVRNGVISARSLGSSRLYVERRTVEKLLIQLEQTPKAQRSDRLSRLKDYCRNAKVPLARVVAEWASGEWTAYTVILLCKDCKAF